MATALSVSRSDLVCLFQEIGYSKPEAWDDEKMLEKVKNLPKYMKDHSDVDIKNPDTEDLLTEIIEALSEDTEIEISGNVPQYDDDEKDEKKEEAKTTTSKKDDEEYDLEEESEEEEEEPAPKKRGRPKGSKNKPAVTSSDDSDEDDSDDEEEDTPAPKKKKDEEKLPVKHMGFTFEEKSPAKLVTVSKDLANKFRDMNRFPRDRELQTKRLSLIKEAIKNGEFRGTEWASCYCEETKETYRINGKHSSHAFSDLFDEEVVFPEDVQILVREFTCPTMEDVAGLFNTYDAKESARNKQDILRSYAVTNKSTKDMKPRILGVLTSALSFVQFGNKYRKVSTSDQAGILLRNSKFANWFSSFVDGKKPGEVKHIMRMSVCAAMYLTWKKDKEACTDFWTKIRDDSDDPKNSPVRVLHRHLLGVKVGGGGEHESTMLHHCLQAWNAYRNEEDTVKLKKKDGEALPEVA